MSDVEEELLKSVPKTAKALGVGLTTTWGLVKTGDLKAVKIGTRTLITNKSIVELVERLSREAV